MLVERPPQTCWSARHTRFAAPCTWHVRTFPHDFNWTREEQVLSQDELSGWADPGRNLWRHRPWLEGATVGDVDTSTEGKTPSSDATPNASARPSARACSEWATAEQHPAERRPRFPARRGRELRPPGPPGRHPRIAPAGGLASPALSWTSTPGGAATRSRRATSKPAPSSPRSSAPMPMSGSRPWHSNLFSELEGDSIPWSHSFRRQGCRHPQQALTGLGG